MAVMIVNGHLLSFAPPLDLATHAVRPNSLASTHTRPRISTSPHRRRRRRRPHFPTTCTVSSLHQSPGESLYTTTVTISGLKCGGCVARCERLIESSLPLCSATANLVSGRLVIASANSPAPSQAEIAAVLSPAGFSVVSDAKSAPSSSLSDRTSLVLGALLLALSCWTNTLCCASLSVTPALNIASLALVALYIALPLRNFFAAGLADLRRLSVASMPALVTLSVAAQTGLSVLGVVSPSLATPRSHETVLLLFFVHAGRLLEESLRRFTTASAASALAKLQPDTVLRVTDEGEEVVPVGDASVRDVVVVRSGDRFPLDGTIESEGLADVSGMSGEAMPAVLESGDAVYAGAINLTNYAVRVAVTKVLDESELAVVGKTVEDALAQKTQTQGLADKAAGILGRVTVSLAVCAVVLHGFGVLPKSEALMAAGPFGPVLVAASLLSAACPCSLALAVPMMSLVAISAAAREGILFRSSAALEAAGSSFNVVGLDKTGTLTTGLMAVSEVAVDERWRGKVSEADILKLAASVELRYSHPIANGIVRFASARKVSFEPVESRFVSGSGVIAEDVSLAPFGLHRGRVFIGSLDWILSLYPKASLWLSSNEERGVGFIAVCIFCPEAGGFFGRISLKEELRARPVDIENLRSLAGKPRLAVLSGDHRVSVEKVCEAVGIGRGDDVVRGGLKPVEKARLVSEISSRRRGNGRVCTVGDGVNDGPLLASADMSFALGRVGEGVAPVAASAALAIVPRGNLSAIVDALTIGRWARFGTAISLMWALFYNVYALVRSCGLLGQFWLPHQAAAAMALSSAVSMTLPPALALCLELRRKRKKGPEASMH